MAAHLGWRGRLCTAAAALALYFCVASFVSVNRIALSQGARGSALLSAAGGGGGGSGDQPRVDMGRHLRGSPQQQLSASSASAASGAMLRAVPVAHLSPKRLRASRIGPAIEWCRGPLRAKAPPGPAVALASFPGSGNTWLRYLLQQATGIN